MKLKEILQNVPDPRGKQGQDYTLWSILSLIIVGLLCGRRGLKAAFLIGRAMTARQRNALGLMNGTTPCHATLTETLRAIDARALAEILGALVLLQLDEHTFPRRRRIDLPVLEGLDQAAERLPANRGFFHIAQKNNARLEVLGKPLEACVNEAKAALELLHSIVLKGRVITGDAMFCQKSITAKIVERGGDYILPVKDNQKNLRENIETAFNEPVFPPHSL